MPVRANAMLFGTLVHETIEDVHRAALRHEEQTITEENVNRWFASNYVSLTKTEHTYLAGPQRLSLIHILFLLAGERKNICVVGDDDQGLYLSLIHI